MKAKLIEESVPVREPKPGEWLLDPTDKRVHICVGTDDRKLVANHACLLDTTSGRVWFWNYMAQAMVLKFVKPKDAEIPVVQA